MAKAHQADCGNALPTTYMGAAKDVYAEGALVFPAVRVQREYQHIDDMALFALAVGMVPVDPKPTRLVALTSPRERLSPLGASCLSLIKHIREQFWSSQSPTQARPS